MKRLAKWIKDNKRIVPHHKPSDNVKAIAIAVVPHIIACTIISFFYPAQILGIFFFGLIFPDVFGFIHLHTKHHKKRENNFPHFSRSMFTKKFSHIILAVISAIFLFTGFYSYFYAGLSHILIDLAGF